MGHNTVEWNKLCQKGTKIFAVLQGRAGDGQHISVKNGLPSDWQIPHQDRETPERKAMKNQDSTVRMSWPYGVMKDGH